MNLIAPDLWWLPTTAANAYLWRDGAGLVVVDPGLPGDDEAVLAAADALGAPVTRIVLTHWHSDHSGAAAALAARTGAAIHAGAEDAAVLRGAIPGAPPDLTADERPIHEAIAGADPDGMAPPHLDTVRALADGDRLGDDAVVVHLGGHTPGSVAVHLPGRAAVLTGDVAMRDHEGRIGLGLFHVDREGARAALRTLAALSPVVAGFGHGDPELEDARRRLGARRETPPPGL